MLLKTWLIKRILNLLDFLFSLSLFKLWVTLFKIGLRFTILIATNLEWTKRIIFIVWSLTIGILINFLNLFRDRQFFLSLNFFALKLIYLNFGDWPLSCCFFREIWFLLFFWLVSKFLTNTANSKWSKLLMNLYLFFMAVTVVFRSFSYHPVIGLTWTWTVHILSTYSRNR